MRFNLTSSHTGNKHRGFTVVELMIATAIAAILMLGVIQTFVMSKHSYKLDDALARAQENARYAVNYLTREIRMAGYVGCRASSANNVANLLNYTPGDWKTDFNDAIQGWEGDATNATFPTEFKANSIPGTDAFVVHRAADTQYQIVKDKPNAATMDLNTTAGLSKFDIVVASDCSEEAIFQLSTINQGGGVNIQHQTGSGTPGNCTKGLGVPRLCTANGNQHNFGVNSGVLLKMTATAYYIGQSNSGNGHALFRLDMSQGGVGNPEELADGIEDMQVLYGVDTNLGLSNDPGLATQYVPANQVADFKQVVSVRLGLLVDTVTDNVTRSQDSQNYPIADTLINAATPGTGVHEHPIDHRLRFPITTTIKLRNRGVM